MASPQSGHIEDDNSASSDEASSGEVDDNTIEEEGNGQDEEDNEENGATELIQTCANKYIPQVALVDVPYVGMTFNSDEDAREFFITRLVDEDYRPDMSLVNGECRYVRVDDTFVSQAADSYYVDPMTTILGDEFLQ